MTQLAKSKSYEFSSDELWQEVQKRQANFQKDPSQELELSDEQLVFATQPFAMHRQWQVTFQLAVIFPDGYQTWHIDFSEDLIQVKHGRNPLAIFFTTLQHLLSIV